MNLAYYERYGHRIAYKSYEHPDPVLPPVVFVHGLTASLNFWEPGMLEEIRRDRSWYSISLPFHYPSTYEGKYTTEALNEHVFSELLCGPIECCIPTGGFHLVGYSLGGFACLNYAAKHGERVLSVSSIGGFMTGRAKGLEGVLQFFAKGTFFRRALFHTGWWMMQRNIVFLKLATIFYARRWRQLLRFPALDPTLRAIWPDVKHHNSEAQRTIFRYLLDMDLMDELDDINIPVLAIAGTADPIIPYRHQVNYADKLADAKLASLEGVGHVAFAEAPEAFERNLLAWLARHDVAVSPLP